MDLIDINGLVFSGIHGVHKREKQHPQRFGVDISLSCDARTAGETDKIADTVDYGPVRDSIRDVIERQSYDLIEKVATEITRRILTDTRVQSVRVTIRKLDLWDNGVPCITITRPFGGSHGQDSSRSRSH